MKIMYDKKNLKAIIDDEIAATPSGKTLYRHTMVGDRSHMFSIVYTFINDSPTAYDSFGDTAPYIVGSTIAWNLSVWTWVVVIGVGETVAATPILTADSGTTTLGDYNCPAIDDDVTWTDTVTEL